MAFLKYRVKVLENFKDGNILGGKFLRANDILVIDEDDFVKVQNSGGVLEILDQLIPNPTKAEPVEVEVARLEQEVAQLEQEMAKVAEVAQAEEVIERAEVEKPAPKRRGRPKKVSNE